MRALCALAALMALFASGCDVKTVPTGKAGLPEDGKVRISGKKISETPKAIAYEWSIIGDRNWTHLAVDHQIIQFSKSYPLNSKAQTNGTNLWIITAVVQEIGVGSGRSGKIQLGIRGSDATQYAAEVPVTLSEGALASSIRSALTGDSSTSIDGQKSLITVGRTTLAARFGR